MAPLLELLFRGFTRTFNPNLFNRPQTEREQGRLMYRGAQQALVIGIDVGMTLSGVSYALLLPDREIKINPVTFFGGQAQGNSKVPTVLHYDQQGNLLARGAETTDMDHERSDDAASPLRVEWFKLLFARGYKIPSRTSSETVPEIIIPPGKDAVDLWADYLKYLYESLKTYITERETNGHALWEQTEKGAFLVLSHPNGWGGYEQQKVKDAVVKAGLVADNPIDRDRVSFVSEGEAGFRWWAASEEDDQLPPSNSHVVVCDAGGGTIDVSSFSVTSPRPPQVREAGESVSKVSGSIFVTQKFRKYAEQRLKGSEFGREDYIDSMVQKFDTQTKCYFEDSTKEQSIRFGFAGDNDIERGIKKGYFRVPGDRMVDFFQKSCDDAVDAINGHLKDKSDSHVFILGGFSESNWLYARIKDSIEPSTVNVSRAKYYPGKPVAYGAVAYCIDRVVKSRIAKHTYGIKEDILVSPRHTVHRALKRALWRGGKGDVWTPGGFRTIVQKGHPINDDDTIRAPQEAIMRTRQPRMVKLSLYRYSGSQEGVDFFSMASASLFDEVCTFSVKIPRSALIECDGGNRWKAQYDVVLLLGQAEIRCYVEWQEQGKPQRSRATSSWKDI